MLEPVAPVVCHCMHLKLWNNDAHLVAFTCSSVSNIYPKKEGNSMSSDWLLFQKFVIAGKRVGWDSCSGLCCSGLCCSGSVDAFNWKPTVDLQRSWSLIFTHSAPEPSPQQSRLSAACSAVSVLGCLDKCCQRRFHPPWRTSRRWTLASWSTVCSVPGWKQQRCSSSSVCPDEYKIFLLPLLSW